MNEDRQNSDSEKPKITFTEKPRFQEETEERLATLLHDASELFRRLSYDQLDLAYKGSGNVHDKVHSLCGEFHVLITRVGFTVDQLRNGAQISIDGHAKDTSRRVSAKFITLSFMSQIITFLQKQKNVMTQESLRILFGHMRDTIETLSYTLYYVYPGDTLRNT